MTIDATKNNGTSTPLLKGASQDYSTLRASTPPPRTSVVSEEITGDAEDAFKQMYHAGPSPFRTRCIGWDQPRQCIVLYRARHGVLFYPGDLISLDTMTGKETRLHLAQCLQHCASMLTGGPYTNTNLDREELYRVQSGIIMLSCQDEDGQPVRSLVGSRCCLELLSLVQRLATHLRTRTTQESFLVVDSDPRSLPTIVPTASARR